MGYRHYFCKVRKSEVDRVRNCSISECNELAENFYHSETTDSGFMFNDKKFMDKVCVFEFGKLYYENTASRIYETGAGLDRKSVV